MANIVKGPGSRSIKPCHWPKINLKDWSFHCMNWCWISFSFEPSSLIFKMAKLPDLWLNQNCRHCQSHGGHTRSGDGGSWFLFWVIYFKSMDLLNKCAAWTSLSSVLCWNDGELVECCPWSESHQCPPAAKHSKFW